MLFVATRSSKYVCKLDEAVVHPIKSYENGILTPSFLTHIDFADIEKLANMSYPECLAELVYRFCDGFLSKDTLLTLSYDAFKDFNRGFGMSNKQCVGDKYFTTLSLEENIEIANLSYGPTGCCKDYAFCFTASVLNYLAKQCGEKMSIIDFSCGNSGLCTAWAVRGKENLKAFTLFSTEKNSSLNALMAQALREFNNVSCAVVNADVNFYNNISYHLQTNNSFRELINLGFINEINILNIFAYLPVFFKSYIKCNARPFSVCIPTGNMSLGMSAYFAKKIGIPIQKIILAVEKDRFFPELQASKIAINYQNIESGFTSFHVNVPTNFERLLFYLYDSNQSSVKRSMTELAINSRYKIQDYLFSKFSEDFYVAQCDNQFKARQTIYSLIREKEVYVEQHFAISKIAMDIAVSEIGGYFAGSPIVLFNTLDFKRNIDFVNSSLGYDVERVNLPWTKEDIQDFSPVELTADRQIIFKHILDDLQKSEN